MVVWRIAAANYVQPRDRSADGAADLRHRLPALGIGTDEGLQQARVAGDDREQVAEIVDDGIGDAQDVVRGAHGAARLIRPAGHGGSRTRRVGGLPPPGDAVSLHGIRPRAPRGEAAVYQDASGEVL